MSRYLRTSTAALILSAAAITGVLAGSPANAATAGSDPLKDANVTGSLTLCNRAGQPMTSGRLTTAPFVWKAISSTPAPAAYRSGSGRATLTAYQPIKFVDPGDWSGGQLTGSSSFTNPMHPVAQATNGDGPLLNFVQAFPPHFNGYVEIRMLFSGVDQPSVIDSYPAAVLKVSKTRWRLVSGGGGSCSDGAGTSDEPVLLNPKRLKHRQQVVLAGNKSHPGRGKSHTGKASRPDGTVTKPPRLINPTSAAAESDGSDGTSSGAKLGIGLAVIAVLGALGAGIAIRRRGGAPS